MRYLVGNEEDLRGWVVVLEGGHGLELAGRLVERHDLHAVRVLLEERAEREAECAAPRGGTGGANAGIAGTHCPVHRVQRPRRLVLVDLLLTLPNSGRADSAGPSAATLIAGRGRHYRALRNFSCNCTGGYKKIRIDACFCVKIRKKQVKSDWRPEI